MKNKKQKHDGPLPKAKHKTKVIYKYVNDGISVDRPKPLAEERQVVDALAFRKDLRRLVVQHLKTNKIGKKDLTLALCQLQDQTSLFKPAMFDRIKEKAGF